MPLQARAIGPHRKARQAAAEAWRASAAAAGSGRGLTRQSAVCGGRAVQVAYVLRAHVQHAVPAAACRAVRGCSAGQRPAGRPSLSSVQRWQHEPAAGLRRRAAAADAASSVAEAARPINLARAAHPAGRRAAVGPADQMQCAAPAQPHRSTRLAAWPRRQRCPQSGPPAKMAKRWRSPSPERSDIELVSFMRPL